MHQVIGTIHQTKHNHQNYLRWRKKREEWNSFTQPYTRDLQEDLVHEELKSIFNHYKWVGIELYSLGCSKKYNLISLAQ